MLYYYCMKNIILKYNVIIQKEGKHYVAYVPTLGMSDFGKSIEEANKNVHEAIKSTTGICS